jgi:hypothetical protein
MRSSFRSLALAWLAVAAFAPTAAAVTIWSEGVDGDLSGNRLAPTSIALGVGTNSIVGTTIAGDVDFFTVTVPSGASFGQLVLASLVSTDDLAFLAIESGPIITSTGSAANLLGWIHPSAAFLGTDILDDMALGAGALGFTPPLGPGTYAMWMQQTQPQSVSYQLDLVLVPEPSAAALLALGLGGLAASGAKRRAQRAAGERRAGPR